MSRVAEAVPNANRPLVARLAIERLRVEVRLGWEAAERATAQPVWVSVTLRFPEPPAAAATDELGGTVDYGEIAALVRAVATRAEYRLIERLTHAVHGAVGALLPPNVGLEVTIAKRPVIGGLEGDASFTLTDA